MSVKSATKKMRERVTAIVGDRDDVRTSEIVTDLLGNRATFVEFDRRTVAIHTNNRGGLEYTLAVYAPFDGIWPSYMDAYTAAPGKRLSVARMQTWLFGSHGERKKMISEGILVPYTEDDDDE